MENAVKALLIAAGMFIALLLISLIVILYNDVSEYYASQHENKELEQVAEFNAKFENYNRNNVRGSDLLSLMNRVIDYNASESYVEDKSYEKIKVTITLVDNGQDKDAILEQFKYNRKSDGTTRNEFLASTITNTNGTGTKWQNDRALVAITNTSIDLNATEAQLQQLSSEIANIIVDEDDTKSSSIAYSRFKRAELLKDVLGVNIGTDSTCDVVIDKVTGKTKNAQGKNIINDIKNMVSQYYQYMQFKRAYFDCEEMKYDTGTNRIVEINFKLQTKLENGKETVVFN